MKRVFFISAIMLASVFALVSCDKKEDNEARKNPKATIEGIVYADLDIPEAGLEFAPEGTKLFFRIDAKDLMVSPDDNTSYETLVYTTTVGEKGMYKITLPSAQHSAVSVKISGNDFRVEQEKAGGDEEMVLFTLSNVTVSTMGGQSYIQDLQYAY